MKLLLLDNYDSFTYNLLHYFQYFERVEVDVFRNDKISLEEVAKYDSIILSPGPGLPSDSEILIPLIKKFAPTKKILGVCLGHQAIGEAFGAHLKNLEHVLHGVARKTIVTKSDDSLFSSVPQNFLCGRYHSWVIDESTLPSSLKVIALDEQKNIMAIRHQHYNVCGVQFHPESILTEFGLKIIENWLAIGR